MKREIKFRAWDKHHNRMLFDLQVFSDRRIPSNWNDCGIILMQFTGLLDKNGKEAYEGDILNIKFGGDRNNPPYSHKKMKIYFNEEYLQWYVIGNNIINGNSLKGYHLAEYEIIGNTHENPELLK